VIEIVWFFGNKNKNLPEARGRFLVTPQTNICLGTMYIIFY